MACLLLLALIWEAVEWIFHHVWIDRPKESRLLKPPASHGNLKMVHSSENIRIIQILHF